VGPGELPVRENTTATTTTETERLAHNKSSWQNNDCLRRITFADTETEKKPSRESKWAVTVTQEKRRSRRREEAERRREKMGQVDRATHQPLLFRNCKQRKTGLDGE
jgi:hypothetical protein